MSIPLSKILFGKGVVRLPISTGERLAQEYKPLNDEGGGQREKISEKTDLYTYDIGKELWQPVLGLLKPPPNPN